MDDHRHRDVAAATGLEHCEACARPFVVGVALLDLVDEGLYLVALRCNNCERLSIGVHEDADLERLERRQRRDLEAMAAATAVDVPDVRRFPDGERRP